MARRRSPTPDEDAGFGTRQEQGLGGGGGGRADEFGNEIPDFSGPNYPTPFVDYVPEEIAGNAEAPRQVFGTRGPRTGQTQPQRQAPSVTPGGAAPVAEMGTGGGGGGMGEPDMSSILASLPRGVEAQGAGSGQAPPQGSAPGGSALNAMPPGQAPASAPFQSPSALFDDGGDAGLVGGGSEGLFGGGIGMPGGPSQPKPTELMLALARAFAEGL